MSTILCKEKTKIDNDITLEQFMEQYCPNNKWTFTNNDDKIKKFMCKKS